MFPILIYEKQLVRNCDYMNVAEFAKHMTYRHLDSLGGLTYLSENLDEYVEECYRIFHDRLHAIRLNLEHEHARQQ